MGTRHIRCVVFVTALGAQAQAQNFLGNTWDTDSLIYTINGSTGVASNPRSTGLKDLVGITFGPLGTSGPLYGLTDFLGGDDLYTIDPKTGKSTLVGNTGLSDIVEGDIRYNPFDGKLYGLQNALTGPDRLEFFSIDINSGAATILGDVEKFYGDLSAMAVDGSGNLWVLDNIPPKGFAEMYRLNTANGAILQTVDLDRSFGTLDGMDFDPNTGTLYLADDTLYTVDLGTGITTAIGGTGLGSSLAGLVYVPAPGAGAILGLSAAFTFRRRR